MPESRFLPPSQVVFFNHTHLHSHTNPHRMSASCHMSTNTDTRACAQEHACIYALLSANCCAHLPLSCPEYYMHSPTDSHSFWRNLKVQDLASCTSVAGRKHRQHEENPSSPRRQAQIATKTAKPFTETSRCMGQCMVSVPRGKSCS